MSMFIFGMCTTPPTAIPTCCLGLFLVPFSFLFLCYFPSSFSKNFVSRGGNPDRTDSHGNYYFDYDLLTSSLQSAAHSAGMTPSPIYMAIAPKLLYHTPTPTQSFTFISNTCPSRIRISFYFLSYRYFFFE